MHTTVPHTLLFHSVLLSTFAQPAQPFWWDESTSWHKIYLHQTLCNFSLGHWKKNIFIWEDSSIWHPAGWIPQTWNKWVADRTAWCLWSGIGHHKEPGTPKLNIYVRGSIVKNNNITIIHLIYMYETSPHRINSSEARHTLHAVLAVICHLQIENKSESFFPKEIGQASCASPGSSRAGNAAAPEQSSEVPPTQPRCVQPWGPRRHVGWDRLNQAAQHWKVHKRHKEKVNGAGWNGFQRMCVEINLLEKPDKKKHLQTRFLCNFAAFRFLTSLPFRLPAPVSVGLDPSANRPEKVECRKRRGQWNVMTMPSPWKSRLQME